MRSGRRLMAFGNTMGCQEAFYYNSWPLSKMLDRQHHFPSSKRGEMSHRSQYDLGQAI